MNTMTEKQSLTMAFQSADDLWAQELKAAFGKRAGDVRYTKQGNGEPGTPLRAAYEKRTACRIAWESVAFKKGE